MSVSVFQGIDKANSETLYCFKVSPINPLPDDKILGLPKLKAFADDKSDVTQNIKVVFHRIENTVGKEENGGYQHFVLFLQCFQKAFSEILSKTSLCFYMSAVQVF